LRKRIVWPPPARVSSIARRSGRERICLASACALRLLLREIDDLDGGERPAADAAREREAVELALLGAEARFERRRRGAEDQRTARAGGAALGQLAGVVAEALFVLVGAVVLLVDHDETERLERREEGAARADGDRGLARAQPLPLREALAGAQTAVEHGDLVAETRPQPRHDLMGQRDLGDEDEGLSAGGEGLGDGLQVDLGLAAARDAMEQVAGGELALDRVADGREGLLLVVG
jgi:hypothetical protein